MGLRLGYLSGSPRVSTVAEAELCGPRAHVLGVIEGFESLGWAVRQYIVGDRVPREWVGVGSEQSISRDRFRALAADLVRLATGPIYARRAWRELGNDVDWVYERFGIFQEMGRRFQEHGKLWILETNGPAVLEAQDRGTLALSRLAKQLEVRAYRKCDYLVCVTERLKQMILEEVDLPESKVIVMHNGADLSLFDPARHNPIRLFEGFTLGYAGSLIPRQNLDLLLEVLNELHAEQVPINLAVIGDGPMRRAWEAQATALGMSARVRFVGLVPREEVPDYMLGLDVGFSGHKELAAGQIFYSPLKLYEYMAMGIPVVASRHEETQRVIKDGETGFLFRPGDGQELKQALTQAYKQRQQLRGMGLRGRQEVAAEHTWISRVRASIQYIESAMKERPARKEV